MKILNSIRTFFVSRFHRFQRNILTVWVFVEVRSPFYKATATIHHVWFKRVRREAGVFKVPLDEDYHVDVEYIFEKVPADVLSIKYPHDWHETMDKLMEEEV